VHVSLICGLFEVPLSILTVFYAQYLEPRVAISSSQSMGHGSLWQTVRATCSHGECHLRRARLIGSRLRREGEVISLQQKPESALQVVWVGVNSLSPADRGQG